MTKKITLLLLTVSFFIAPQCSFAWGAKGHRLVAEIAFHFLDANTRQKVQQYLGKISFDEAGTWMDDMRSNSYYDYMKSWHYVDIAKDSTLKSAPEKNLITVLNAAVRQLEQNQSNLSDKEIKMDLLLIFHLVGDMHQPLHCGYPEDKGGNLIDVHSEAFSSNLHSAWDTEIIDAEDIGFYDCLKYYDDYSKEDIKAIQKINLLQWMNQSRSLLDTVYDYKNGFLDKHYIERSSVIIKKQLLIGGLRLASILTEAMKNYNPDITLPQEEKISSEKIKPIAIKDLADYKDEIVKVCTTIADGKYFSGKGVTVLEGNSKTQTEPLIILIEEKDRNNFKAPPENYYDNKNICVTGKVKLYEGKPIIVIESDSQISIQ